MISKADPQLAFENLYKRLNEAQKKAVDTIEGPVMVIAGPGTGKTQILGARIGKILLETDTAPENILCLTYTDAGAIAMRKRLMDFIGTAAYKVTIATFHSFCNDIIQDNLSLFEKPSLDPISELEKIELLKKLIDQFDKNNPLIQVKNELLTKDIFDEYFFLNNFSSLVPHHSKYDLYICLTFCSESIFDQIFQILQKIENIESKIFIVFPEILKDEDDVRYETLLALANDSVNLFITKKNVKNSFSNFSDYHISKFNNQSSMLS